MGRGKGRGDNSDDMQIGSQHATAAGTVSSSRSNSNRKASSNKQQRRGTSAATAGNSGEQQQQAIVYRSGATAGDNIQTDLEVFHDWTVTCGVCRVLGSAFEDGTCPCMLRVS
jgi:hypothetical protein